MTEPDSDAYLSALALIEAVNDQRHQDAHTIITEASLDTMLALANVSLSVLKVQGALSGTSVHDVTSGLRKSFLNRELQKGS